MTAGSSTIPRTAREVLTAAVPVAVPVVMVPVFRGLVSRYGERRGVQAGFAAYWATCWALALGLAGPRELVRAWRRPPVSLPPPPVVAGVVLLLPPLGALATQWLPHARRCGLRAVAAAAGMGVTNALAEEALWRALPVSVFPGRRGWGWWWPALGFAVWHLAPMAAEPVERGRREGVLLGAALIGSGYGWIALRTGSVAVVSAAHAVTDASGVRQAAETWLPPTGCGA